MSEIAVLGIAVIIVAILATFVAEVLLLRSK